MWLYRLLDGVFPSSFAAKLGAVAVIVGLLPALAVLAYLLIAEGVPGARDPALFVAVTGSGIAITLNLMGISSLMEPLRELRRSLGAASRKKGYRPLPTVFADELGTAMQSVNQVAEALGARLADDLVTDQEDSLTGALLPDAFCRDMEDTGAGSVLAILLEEFDQFRDQDSDALSDRVLAAIGRALKDATRQGDLVGLRQDGEFCVFLNGAGREVARHVAERIRLQCLKSVEEIAPQIHVTVGLTLRADGEDVDSLWARIMAAMPDEPEQRQTKVVLAIPGLQA